MDSTAPAVTTATRIDPTSKLPAELILEIIKELPVSDICQVRRLSKRFKKVIDENHANILHALIAKQKARILEGYHTLHSTSRLEFNTVIESFVNYYGRIQNEVALRDASFRFFGHFIRQKYPNIRDETTLFALVRYLDYIASWIINTDDIFEEGRIPIRGALDGFVRWFDRDMGPHSADSLALCIDSIKSITLRDTTRCYAEDDFPRLYLTSCKRYRGCTFFEKSERDSWRIVKSKKRIVTLLRLPTLHPGCRFAYCVKTPKMWQFANRYFTRKGEKMTLFRKAALLEDIFIW